MTKKIITLWLFFIIFSLALPLTIFAATGSTVSAKQTCSDGSEHSFCLNIPIGQLTGFDVVAGSSIMGDYIKSWYGFMLGSVGILATVMIMWGGFKYLVSRGDKASIESAKTQMISAVTGVVLAFGTYTLLYLINPALLTINTPNLPGIQGGGNVKLQALLNSNFKPNLIPTNATEGQAMTQQYEGLKTEIYEDPVTHVKNLIGYGHKITGQEIPIIEGTITPDRAEELFQLDYKDAENNARAFFPTYDSLSPARQAVLNDMTYQMGGEGITEFVKLQAAVTNGDWEAAGAEIIDSDLNNQTPNRTGSNAIIMVRGS